MSMIEAETSTIFLSIVMPSYNDAEVIDQFLPELYSLFKEIQKPCEILLVDDGSKDHLYQVYEKHINQLNDLIELRLIQFSRNFGKEAALSAGLTEATGQVVVLMDSDGQHPVSVLKEMLETYQANQVDMVAAVQATREHENGMLKFFKRGFYQFMQDTARYEIKPNAGDFRLMNRRVVDALLQLPERQRFMKGLYSWVGFKTIYLPFQADERSHGESKFNYANLFELALVGITSFSLKPLRWISRMGLLVSLLALLYGIFIVFDTLFLGRDLAGWPTLAAGIMFSAGLQLICLGVIGEYIGRIYEEVKQRPLYIVDKKWHSKKR